MPRSKFVSELVEEDILRVGQIVFATHRGHIVAAGRINKDCLFEPIDTKTPCNYSASQWIRAVHAKELAKVSMRTL